MVYPWTFYIFVAMVNGIFFVIMFNALPLVYRETTGPSSFFVVDVLMVFHFSFLKSISSSNYYPFFSFFPSLYLYVFLTYCTGGDSQNDTG